MFKDKRPVEEQVKDFLSKYGSGDCRKKELWEDLMELTNPVIVEKVEKDDKGNVMVKTKPVPIEKHVAIAKAMATDLNKHLDSFFDKQHEKDVKKYRKEHGGQDPPSDYDFALGRSPTLEDKERLDRILNPPLEEKLNRQEFSVKIAIDRVNSARAEHTRKQYVRKAQKEICELQEIQEQILKKQREQK